MLISKSHNFIFIHVPKTGGTSIEYFLSRVRLKGTKNLFWRHATALQIRSLVFGYDDYFKFGFVRNPWEAQLSMYSYILGMGPRHPEWNLISGFESFSQYVKLYLQPKWQLHSPLNQVDYLFDASGSQLVTMVCRYERFGADFRSVLGIIGIAPPHDILIKNASRHGHYREYYDLESRHIVEREFSRDSEMFKYVF